MLLMKPTKNIQFFVGANHCPGSFMFLFERLDSAESKNTTKRYKQYPISVFLDNFVLSNSRGGGLSHRKTSAASFKFR